MHLTVLLYTALLRKSRGKPTRIRQFCIVSNLGITTTILVYYLGKYLTEICKESQKTLERYRRFCTEVFFNFCNEDIKWKFYM